jgi:hypothetical protein
MHLWPRLEELTLVFVGPDVARAPPSEAPSGELPTASGTSDANFLCGGCKARGARVVVRRVRSTYERFLDKESGAAGGGAARAGRGGNKADLVVCSHSGMHSDSRERLFIEGAASGPGDASGPENASASRDRPTVDSRASLRSLWRPAIERLIAARTPCLFTSYTPEEIRLDAERLGALGARTILPAQRNPFRSLRPFADPLRVDRVYGTDQWLLLVGE